MHLLFSQKKGIVNLKNSGFSVDTKSKEMSQSAVSVPPIQPVNFEKDKTLKDMYQLLYQVTGMVIPKEMKKN